MICKNNRAYIPVLVALYAVLSSIAGPALAYPITYNIGPGSAPGFSASWLHAGTNQMGNSGFYANGDKFRIAGQLTLDLANSTATGLLTGSGNFGQGDSNWTLSITGASSNTKTFLGGETDLLSLGYILTSAGGFIDDGTFYFAARDFNGGAPDDGPNHIDHHQLFLWGNNWLNANGASDRDVFVSQGGTALGLDLYGVAVPEPPVGLLLLAGLFGMGLVRRQP